MQPTHRPVLQVPATITARTLRNAATYLSRHGWIQGAYYDPDATCFTPAACTVGAIGMVCYGGPVDAPAQMFHDPGFDAFEDAVTFLDQVLTVWFGQDVYGWNDDRARAMDQVLHTLIQAAEVCQGTSTVDGAR
jgi:hypothetical protein